MLLMIDNYDSFTYNLVQYFQILGQELVVRTHDAVTIDQIKIMKPSHIIISPGPGSPAQSGISLPVIDAFKEQMPILGVCLGHQCLGQYFGGNIVRAERIMHGKTSLIRHQGRGLFSGLKNDLRVTRYHSLLVEPQGLPEVLRIDAYTDEGEIMALTHRTLPLFGVQFHPESVLSEQGLALLKNFLHPERLLS